LGHWTVNPFRNIGGIHLPGRTHGPRPKNNEPVVMIAPEQASEQV